MTTITCTPGVQGGEPCVAGTRTPVRSVAVLYYEIYRDRFKVQAALPHLTLDQIDAALNYYLDHKAEIDALIEAQDRALEELAQKWISPEPLTEAQMAQAQRFAARHGLLREPPLLQ